MSEPSVTPLSSRVRAQLARNVGEAFSSSQGNSIGSNSSPASSSLSSRDISTRLASTKRFPSFLTSSAPVPGSRLKSTPFVPPAVNQEKLCWELTSTPPRLLAASISTTLAVFALISSLLFTGKSLLRGHAYWFTPLAKKPPSTVTISPVTKLAASDARKTAAPATSSTLPNRLIGVRNRNSRPRSDSSNNF